MPPSCNDQIQPGSYPYYCEWKLQGGQWCNINARVPYNYYCADPPGTGSAFYGGGNDSELYLYPCPIRRSISTDSGYAQATYKFWNGNFYLIASSSQNGGTCPGNLVRYSQNHPGFSFLVSFEFSTTPYVRATYKFQRGIFTVVEGSSGNGAWPTDLVACSRSHKEFSFLVALEFFGVGVRPKSKPRGRKSAGKGAKSASKAMKSGR